MVKILQSKEQIDKFLKSISKRGRIFYDKVRDSVKNILNDVMINGDDACLKYIKKFDGIELEKNEIRVTKTEIQDAYGLLDEKLIDAIKNAKKNIKKFHEIQVPKPRFIETSSGVEVGQIAVPYEIVGLYIPGGRALYPSTVLMTAIPAKIAGIKRIIMTTPPNNEKKIHPAVLVAANEAGVNEIYKISGVQAIAAMAYGTKIVPKVNKIIGPGNIYVNTAKLLVNQQVAIDVPAGPSEILIIADANSNYKFIASDIISQAEHDPDSFTFLVSNSMDIIQKVYKLITSDLSNYSRKNIIESSLKNNCYLIFTKNIEDMFKISNIIAPEHLELQIKTPDKYLSLIQNAGAIFIGQYAPVPIGDYAAGSNHVLPTGGLAKIYSGLSLYDFFKFIDVVRCSKTGLENLKDIIIPITDIEGFDAHKKTILGRLEP
ncbi:MAG: histidinol dehydrogenase [Candidatus Helarchaeota archaeon]